MAVSHVLKQVDGNEVRSAMSAIDLDGNMNLSAGDTIGMTVATGKNGSSVDASAALLYTVPAGGESNHDAVRGMCAAVTGALTGAVCYFSENPFDKFTIHFEGIASIANEVDISLPVLTVA